MTEVKDSLIEFSGRGVFAKKNYKKGDYICYYDGEEKLPQNCSKDEVPYCIDNPLNNKLFVGYKFPKTQTGIGQLINDFCRFELLDEYKNEKRVFTLSSPLINKKIKEYTEKSIINSNVTFHKGKKNLFKIFAKKDIKTGEELYLHYGINYWLCDIINNTKYPSTKLYCLLKSESVIINKDVIFLKSTIFTPTNFLYYLGIDPTGNMIRSIDLLKFSDLTKIKKLIEILS